MTDEPVKIGMKPPHPGSFVREEILDELGLSVTQAAEILGVRRATLSDLVRSSLRLRPDRIPIGEVRGAEALDLPRRGGPGIRAASAPSMPVPPLARSVVSSNSFRRPSSPSPGR